MLEGSAAELKALQSGPIFWHKYLLLSLVLTIVLLFFLSLFAFIAGPLLAWPVAAYWARDHAEKVMTVTMLLQNKLLKEVLGEPRAPAYFCIDYLTSPSGIAVDPDNKTLTAVTWSGPLTKDRLNQVPEDCLRKDVFSVQNIVQWRSFKPEVTTLERIGDSRHFTMNEKLQIDATNRRALNQQTATTGLTITTNLLDNQEVFLNLNHEAAKKWMLLLTKFSNGDLPAVTVPTEFPQPSQS